MRPILLLLLASSILRAESPALDPYGDPLPEGAISRIGSLRNSRNEVGHLVITPDGSRFVNGIDFSLVVRDTRTLAEIRTIPLIGGGQNWRATISAEGKRVAAVLGWPLERDGSHRKIVVVWDVASGKQLCEVERKDKETGGHALALSADGKKLAALGRMIDVDSQRVTHEIPATRDLKRLTFVADDRYLIDNESTVWRFWEAATGKEVRCESEPPEAKRRYRQFARDGKSMFFVEEQNLVRIDLELPNADHATVKVTSHKKFPLGESVAIALIGENGNRCLLRASLEKGPPSLRLFNSLSGKVIESIPVENDTIRKVHASALTEKGALLVVLPDFYQMSGVDLATFEIPDRKNLTLEQGLRFVGHDLDWMPDGKRLRTGKQIWDAPSGKFLGEAKPEDTPRERWEPIPWPKNTMLDLVTAESGIAVVFPMYAGQDGRGSGPTHSQPLQVWNRSKTEKLHDLSGIEPGQFTHLNYRGLSRDGSVFVQDDRHELFVWDTRSGRLLIREKAEAQSLDLRYLLPKICPTGRQFVCAPGGRLMLYDVPSRSVALDLKLDSPANQWLSDLDWSPDGRLVAILTRENEIRLYDLHSAKQVQIVRTTQRNVHTVRFSPDGRSILTHNSLYGLIWPVPNVEPFFKPLKEAEFAAAWDQLRSRSESDCREASQRFIASGDAAVRFLDRHLEADPGPPPERFDALLTRLKSDDFRTRTVAEKEWLDPDELTLARFRRLLDAGTPDADLTARLNRLIESAKGTVPPHTTETLRQLRGIAALEAIRTETARKTLERLAKGWGASPITREARGTLERIR